MRALQVNSRRFDMFCFHVSKSMSKVRSTHDSASTGSPSPAASVVELWAKSGTVPSPFAFQIVSASSAGTSAIPKRTACRQRRARTKATAGRDEEQRVGRLQREGDAGERSRRAPPPAAPRPRARDGERGRDEDRDDRREVRLLGQPERLGEDLVDPAVVVAVDEERDRDERRRDEHGRAPEPGEAAREPRADVVDGERRDRAEHADLEDGRQGEELDRARARDPGQRREQHRPAVAREREPIEPCPSSQPLVTSQIWSPPWYVSQPLWLTEKKSATVARTWTATIVARAIAT